MSDSCSSHGCTWPDLAIAGALGLLALTAVRSVIQQARAEFCPVPAHACQERDHV